MNILMIYPNKVMVTRAPLGIGYLSAYLKDAGHNFKLFDTTFVKPAIIKVLSFIVIDCDSIEY